MTDDADDHDNDNHVNDHEVNDDGGHGDNFTSLQGLHWLHWPTTQ